MLFLEFVRNLFFFHRKLCNKIREALEASNTIFTIDKFQWREGEGERERKGQIIVRK